MILKDECLRSFYHRLAQVKAKKLGISFDEALETFKQYSPYESGEWERKNNVYFARDKKKNFWEGRTGVAYKQGIQVILGFGVPEEMTGNYLVVMMPELSLDYLVEAHAQPKAIDRVRLLLKKEHDGKYKHIPVYSRK